MDYKVYSPSKKLSRYIKCYWSLENFDSTIPHSRERIFPDGCIELIFHYGDLFRKYDSKENFEIQPRNFIYGQIKKFIELQGTGKIGIFSIRFHPFGFQHFINFNVSQLTGKTSKVSEMWQNDGNILEEKMFLCSDNEQRISLIENFLEEKFRDFPNEIEFCVNEIIKHGGMIAIEKMAQDLNIGKRHLERKFLSCVGLSQKLFSRIIRFNNALQLIENKDFNTFTNVAHEGGFYDQAHFIKDFKEFTGLNPKKYFSENLEMAKYFNLE